MGACHHSNRNRPPPPRLVGVNPAAGFVCASAMPLAASIWLASGAVSPTPTIVRMNERRERRPAFTSRINPRIAYSSMSSSTDEHPYGHVDHLDHALVIGDTLPRPVEGRAVIDGH